MVRKQKAVKIVSLFVSLAILAACSGKTNTADLRAKASDGNGELKIKGSADTTGVSVPTLGLFAPIAESKKLPVWEELQVMPAYTAELRCLSKSQGSIASEVIFELKSESISFPLDSKLEEGTECAILVWANSTYIEDESLGGALVYEYLSDRPWLLSGIGQVEAGGSLKIQMLINYRVTFVEQASLEAHLIAVEAHENELVDHNAGVDQFLQQTYRIDHDISKESPKDVSVVVEGSGPEISEFMGSGIEAMQPNLFN